MHPLPIPLLLPIKHRILIPRLHLRLRRHLILPPLHALRHQSLARESGIERRNDGVDGAQAFALARFLWGGEAEGDFPVERIFFSLVRMGFWVGERERERKGGIWIYQRRPPEREEVALKGPNMVDV